MFPEGHAKNTSGNLARLLDQKFRLLAGLGVSDPAALAERFTNLGGKTAAEVRELYAFSLSW
jgi:hypothetical protein